MAHNEEYLWTHFSTPKGGGGDLAKLYFSYFTKENSQLFM